MSLRDRALVVGAFVAAFLLLLSVTLGVGLLLEAHNTLDQLKQNQRALTALVADHSSELQAIQRVVNAAERAGPALSHGQQQLLIELYAICEASHGCVWTGAVP